MYDVEERFIQNTLCPECKKFVLEYYQFTTRTSCCYRYFHVRCLKLALNKRWQNVLKSTFQILDIVILIPTSLQRTLKAAVCRISKSRIVLLISVISIVMSVQWQSRQSTLQYSGEEHNSAALSQPVTLWISKRPHTFLKPGCESLAGDAGSIRYLFDFCQFGWLEWWFCVWLDLLRRVLRPLPLP